MSAYSNQIKALIDRYREEVNGDGVFEVHALAQWAYDQGLYKPNSKTVINAIAADVAQMFREEYRTDGNGQRYRAKHAVTSKQNGKTLSLWADLDDPTAPHDHFVRSFAQRRRQIVGDCFQLKTDVDVYNSRERSEPIQLVLDFTYDVEELQIPLLKAA